MKEVDNVTTATLPRALRPYQIEAVDATLSAWGRDVRRPAIVLPTGTGKSTVIAAIADAAAALGLRVVMLAHRGELLSQMADAVRAVNPAREVGIVRAHLDESDAQIVAASLQTLANDRRLHELGERSVVIFDEVHHVEAPTFKRVLERLGCFEQHGTFFVGLTATMRRDDSKRLGDTIQEIVYERDLRWAIDAGFLVAPRGLTVRIPALDLDRVRVSRGDFVASDLAETMSAATPYVVDAVAEHAGDRRPIVFGVTVDHAHEIAAALTAAGIESEAVDGSMSVEEREVIYGRYRSGVTRALVTVSVLTEGADFPMCDAVVIARPTRSSVLYSQMVGRALRLYPGKRDALVLDLSGTTRTARLVSLSDLGEQLDVRTWDAERGEIIEATEAGAEIGPGIPLRRMGAVDLVEIDLLEGSDALWLRTKGGTVFLQGMTDEAGDVLVFAWSMGGDLYAPAWMTSKGERQGDWIDDAPVDLSAALRAGEAWAREHFLTGVPKRGASWRRSQPASDKQQNFARMLGIRDAEQMTRARLSDEISVVLASRRLDRK